MGEHRRVRRMSLKEAADVLGVSKDAVRQRIRRGTLRSEKGEDGRVYMYLDASVDDVHQEETDTALVEELRDRVRYFERQVEEEREARRRADTLLARLMDRVPELEAPQEPPGSPEATDEQQGSEPCSIPQARRMACGGPGGVGCSVGRKKGGWLWMTETPRDSTVIRTLPEKRDKPWQDTAWRKNWA